MDPVRLQTLLSKPPDLREAVALGSLSILFPAVYLLSAVHLFPGESLLREANTAEEHVA